MQTKRILMVGPVEVTLHNTIKTLIDNLTREELLDVIIDIDKQVCDWDFTEEHAKRVQAELVKLQEDEEEPGI